MLCSPTTREDFVLRPGASDGCILFDRDILHPFHVGHDGHVTVFIEG